MHERWPKKPLEKSSRDKGKRGKDAKMKEKMVQPQPDQCWIEKKDMFRINPINVLNIKKYKYDKK